jgi:hypothetical protein
MILRRYKLEGIFLGYLLNTTPETECAADPVKFPQNPPPSKLTINTPVTCPVKRWDFPRPRHEGKLGEGAVDTAPLVPRLGTRWR